MTQTRRIGSGKPTPTIPDLKINELRLGPSIDSMVYSNRALPNPDEHANQRPLPMDHFDNLDMGDEEIEEEKENQYEFTNAMIMKLIEDDDDDEEEENNEKEGDEHEDVCVEEEKDFQLRLSEQNVKEFEDEEDDACNEEENDHNQDFRVQNLHRYQDDSEMESEEAQPETELLME